MNKLKACDIILLGEGPQLRRCIEERYRKIESFYESSKLPVSLKTLRTYLSKDVVSDTFKHAIVIALDIDYNKEVASKAMQVKNYVRNVFENVRLYNDEADTDTIDLLISLCKQYELAIETSMMYRVKAENFYNRNRPNGAIEWFEAAIGCIGNFDMNLYMLYTVELADLYYKEGQIHNAEIEYVKAGKCLEEYKINRGTQFKYFFWCGIMLNNIKRHSEARDLFEKAFESIDDRGKKATMMVNIGLTYKRESRIEEALNYYYKALDCYEDEDIAGKAMIFNNIAYMHYEQGDQVNAYNSCINAIALLSLINHNDNFLAAMHTYALIKLRMSDEKACIEYFEALESSSGKIENKTRILNDIVNFIRVLDNPVYLERLIKILYLMADQSSNSEFVDSVYSCVGRACRKLNKVSGVV